MPIGFVKFEAENTGGIIFRCRECGSYITDSGLTTKIHGVAEHSFVNPSGMQCDFITVAACRNVYADPQLYVEHSWFAGYGWRIAVCARCGSHLGWKYDAVKNLTPREFFGILIHAVQRSGGKE
jgi:hypothetical protein